jgi:transporter family protein
MAAFGMTALWAVVMLVNKRILADVSPLALNFFLRGVSAIGLVALTVPLTVLGIWPNGFGLNRAAAGYIALSSLVTWMLAFSTYYYALRLGRVSVVAPIASTDPVWTALFAFGILGAAIGAPTIVGLAVAMIGVALISRWMTDEPDVTVDALAGPAYRPGLTRPAASAAGRVSPRSTVIVLSLVTAAGWGLGPILIDLANTAYGRVTATMMIESQLIGMLVLGALVVARRVPLTPRRLSSPERRRVTRLIVLCGALETVITILFYLCVEHIGPVLTMLIMAASPVFAITIGFAVLRERVGVRLVSAALITLAGVALAVSEGLL